MKALGLIDYDLRRDLSTGQKSRITKLEKSLPKEEYGGFLDYPHKYVVKKVNPKRAHELADSGYVVSRANRAVLPKGKFDTVELRGAKMIRTKGNIKEETILVGSLDFEKEFKKAASKKLQKNQQFSARIGENGHFKETYSSIAALNHYIRHDLAGKLTEKDPEKRKKIFAQLSLVTITNQEYEKYASRSKKASRNR